MPPSSLPATLCSHKENKDIWTPEPKLYRQNGRGQWLWEKLMVSFICVVPCSLKETSLSTCQLPIFTSYPGHCLYFWDS